MNNQVKRLRDYLEAGNKCDPMVALNELGIYNYSARLSDLKAEGVEIESEWFKTVNKFGEKVRFKKHWIKESK